MAQETNVLRCAHCRQECPFTDVRSNYALCDMLRRAADAEQNRAAEVAARAAEEAARPRCEAHSCPADVFCQHCLQLLCPACYNTVDSVHFSHGRVDLVQAAAAVSDNTRRHSAALHEMREKLRSRAQKIGQEATAWRGACEEQERTLEARFAAWRAELDREHQRCAHDMRETRRLGEAQLQKICSDVENAYGAVGTLLAELESIRPQVTEVNTSTVPGHALPTFVRWIDQSCKLSDALSEDHCSVLNVDHGCALPQPKTALPMIVIRQGPQEAEQSDGLTVSLEPGLERLSLGDDPDSGLEGLSLGDDRRWPSSRRRRTSSENSAVVAPVRSNSLGSFFSGRL